MQKSQKTTKKSTTKNATKGTKKSTQKIYSKKTQKSTPKNAKNSPKIPQKQPQKITQNPKNQHQTNSQKAYKLLSEQLDISNAKAKSLIDRGLVSANGKKLTLARIPLPKSTKFSIAQIQKIQILYQDENILCVDKPAFMDSYEVQEKCQDAQGKEWVLLHRLDKETSGCLLFVKKNSEFATNAIKEFSQNRVYKLYTALVSGIINDEQEINLPLLIHKGKSAKAEIATISSNISNTKNEQKISQKFSQKTLQKANPKSQKAQTKNALIKSATTRIMPRFIQGKKTLLEVQIITGRTHQIRAHLNAIGHPIIGDSLYGGLNAARLMLHASEIRIFDYVFASALPSEFALRS